MFPGGARAQPLPLPLGPAYNNSDFNSFVNVTFQMYTDQPARAFAVNQSLLSQLVNQLGQLYYPQGVLFEVSISVCLPSFLPMLFLLQLSHQILASGSPELQLAHRLPV